MKPSFRLKILFPFVVIFAVMVFLTPRNAKWGYDFTVGQTWRYETLSAQFDFPIIKSQDQIYQERSERASNVIPYYKLSGDLLTDDLKKVEGVSFADFPGLKASIVTHIIEIMGRGILPEPAANDIIYIQRDKRAEKVPASEVFLPSSARIALLERVAADCSDVKVDSLLKSRGIYDMLVANLVYDEQITALVHSKNESSVSTTQGYASTGTIIVNKGELITPEIAQMLDSYKLEYEHNMGYDKSPAMRWAGNCLLVIAILFCLYFAVYFTNPMIFKDYNRYLYLLTVFTVWSAIELLFMKFYPDWIFVFPFSVGALYLQTFFRTKVVLPVYMVSLFPLLLFADNGAFLFMQFLVPGIVSLYVFKHFSKGARQFIAAIINFAAALLVFTAFEALGLAKFRYLEVVGMLFVGSVLVVAFHPFVFLLERAFNLVSSNRLQELTDNSNELLRSLEQKAPGTFQHSLQVMNLASAAARAIGADENLVRAGAMYHDVGKLKNPQCFVENESLVGNADSRYHADLTPLQSAQDIIKHVSDGMELAQAHNLPSVVSDFIQTHHGTTCVSYFYDKYLKEGGDPSHKIDFCYQGPVPQTREQVILMLADTLEAASRSLKDYSSESVSDLVERLVSYKIEDAQLEQADITIRELTTVKTVMKTYLAQIYHERIKYPKRKNK